MTNQFKIDSPTYIEEKSFSEKNDLISDDTNELNLEHNWKNKNTTQTNKRKTYLDNCPDWDIITQERRAWESQIYKMVTYVRF